MLCNCKVLTAEVEALISNEDRSYVELLKWVGEKAKGLKEDNDSTENIKASADWWGLKRVDVTVL